MKLEEFVSETLQQIISGVLEAQAFATRNAGAIVPDEPIMGASNGQRLVSQRDEVPIGEIEFDVAVAVDEGRSAQGGAGLFVGPIAIGTQGKENISNQSMNRIKFSVPLKFPRQVSTPNKADRPPPM